MTINKTEDIKNNEEFEIIYVDNKTTKMVEHFFNFFHVISSWKINFPKFSLRTHHLP